MFLLFIFTDVRALLPLESALLPLLSAPMSFGGERLRSCLEWQSCVLGCVLCYLLLFIFIKIKHTLFCTLRVSTLPAGLDSACPNMKAAVSATLTAENCPAQVNSSCVLAEAQFAAAVGSCVSTTPGSDDAAHCMCSMTVLEAIPSSTLASCPSLPQTIQTQLSASGCGCGAVPEVFMASVDHCKDVVASDSKAEANSSCTKAEAMVNAAVESCVTSFFEGCSFPALSASLDKSVEACVEDVSMNSAVPALPAVYNNGGDAALP